MHSHQPVGRSQDSRPAGFSVNWAKRVGTARMDDPDLNTLRERIAELRVEHRDLDEAVAALAADPWPDQLRLNRLKKRKLQLKDAIARLESMLIPDLGA